MKKGGPDGLPGRLLFYPWRRQHVGDSPLQPSEKSCAKHLTDAPSDPGLGWFLQGTDEFVRYIEDMVWSQA